MTLPTSFKLGALLAATALAGAAGFGAGWAANGWRWGAKYSEQASSFAQTRLTEATQATQRLQAMTKERDALAKRLASGNDADLTALQKAQDETSRLADCVRSGRGCGLRIAASCPSSQASGAPSTAASASVDSAAGARLDGAAEQAYFALRSGIDTHTAKLSACQRELRERNGLQ